MHGLSMPSNQPTSLAQRVPEFDPISSFFAPSLQLAVRVILVFVRDARNHNPVRRTCCCCI